MKINIQVAAHYLLIPLKLSFAELHIGSCCVEAAGCWIRSGVAIFTRFIHHFPNMRLLQITPGWAHSSPRPQLSSLPPDPGMWWMCLGTTILVPSIPSSRVCSSHCHQIPASGLWPLPLIHQCHPHDKLAVAHQTTLDSLKIPPPCEPSYINIKDKTEKC